MAGLDVSGFLDDGALNLEGVSSVKHPDGATYRVPALSWPDTLRLRRLMQQYGTGIPDLGDAEGEARTDLEALLKDKAGKVVDYPTKILGPALQQMIDDEVAPSNIDRLLTVVSLHFGIHEETARSFVQVAAGEAQARQNRATRRAATKRTSSPRKAGSSSSRASGAKNTRSSQGTSRGSATSAATPRKAAAKKAV